MIISVVMTATLIPHVGGRQEDATTQQKEEQYYERQLDYNASNVRCIATKPIVNGGDPCGNDRMQR